MFCRRPFLGGDVTIYGQLSFICLTSVHFFLSSLNLSRGSHIYLPRDHILTFSSRSQYTSTTLHSFPPFVSLCIHHPHHHSRHLSLKSSIIHLNTITQLPDDSLHHCSFFLKVYFILHIIIYFFFCLNPFADQSDTLCQSPYTFSGLCHNCPTIRSIYGAFQFTCTLLPLFLRFAHISSLHGCRPIQPPVSKA